MGMNGTGGASTPTQNYGNYPTQGPSAPPCAGSPDLSATGGLDPNSLTPQDQLMLSSMMSQAPPGPPPEEEKKGSIAKMLAVGAAGLGIVAGLGFWAKSGVRASNLKKEMETLKGAFASDADKGTATLKKFELKNSKITPESRLADNEMKHPKAVSHFLTKYNSAEPADRTKLLEKIPAELRPHIEAWHGNLPKEAAAGE